MFYIRIVSVSFWRQRARTLLHLMIYTATVIFLGIYTGNLEGNRSQLQHLAEKVPVEATVINLSGGRESGLFIKESLFDGVMNSKHVQDPLFTLQLTAADKEQDFTILAMTSLNGYEKLFCTSEKACVITSELSESLKLKEGDTLTLDLRYYKLDTDTHLSWQILPLERVSYKIAGITDTDTAPAEIMIPMETARDSYPQDLQTAGGGELTEVHSQTPKPYFISPNTEIHPPPPTMRNTWFQGRFHISRDCSSTVRR